MSAKAVNQHGPLTHKQIACPVQHQDRLLLLTLDRNEGHVRPCHRFGDGGSIGRVVLLAVRHIGLDPSRRDQADTMAERQDPPCPMMRRAARLHADLLGRARKKLSTASRRSLTANTHSAGFVDPMDLKDLFGKIQTDSDNAHVDGPP